jgi:sugar phosphate isomerase/epimerase
MDIPGELLCCMLFGLSAFAVAQQQPPAVPSQQPSGQDASVAKDVRDDSAAEKLGWRLGVQAWTFRDRTAFEAIDTAHALGLKYIELFPGQRLAKEFGDTKVDVGMPEAQLVALKAKAAADQIKITSFGVVDIAKDEAQARKLFDFANALGLETITCEPNEDAWDLVEKLCDEYHVNAACHDHPKGHSLYWNPESVLAAVKDRSQRLGACADTGHWPRSGLNAIACLKQLQGRIITSHFKDIAPADATGIDQPWGTGANDARGMLEELHRQGFKGEISIEYETGKGKELEANVSKCIAFFDQVAAELVKSDAKEAGK